MRENLEKELKQCREENVKLKKELKQNSIWNKIKIPLFKLIVVLILWGLQGANAIMVYSAYIDDGIVAAIVWAGICLLYTSDAADE